MAVSVQAQKKPAPPKPKPPVVTSTNLFKTSLDSASYAFGQAIANDMKSRGVSNLNVQQLTKGMQDAFAGTKPAINEEQSQRAIMNFLSAIQEKASASSKKEETEFLAANKTKAGVVTLPSGLQYQVLTAGTGAKPAATDEVTVHYKGTLLNGKQFDSSYDRNEPLTIQLNQVIKGWTEGVQLMPVGSKYRFFIPSALGYGERGAGQDIPPYSVLIFDIELLKIGK